MAPNGAVPLSDKSPRHGKEISNLPWRFTIRKICSVFYFWVNSDVNNTKMIYILQALISFVFDHNLSYVWSKIVANIFINNLILKTYANCTQDNFYALQTKW